MRCMRTDYVLQKKKTRKLGLFKLLLTKKKVKRQVIAQPYPLLATMIHMRLFFINVPEVFQAASQILLILRYFVKQPILRQNVKFKRDRTIGTPSSGERKNTPKQRYASLVSTKSFLERPLIARFSQKLAPR